MENNRMNDMLFSNIYNGKTVSGSAIICAGRSGEISERVRATKK